MRPPDEQGVSLEDLRRAYAQAMGQEPDSELGLPVSSPDAEAAMGPDGPGDDRDAVEAGLDEGIAEEPAEPAAEGPCEINPTTILEAMLFVGNRASEPLTGAQAAQWMRGVEPGEISDLVDGLNRRYAANGCPYHVISEGAGFRLTLRDEYSGLRNQFYGRLREARLSQAAIDVLAIVAYRQPITGEEVSKLRGTPSGPILAQLVGRRLLEIERPADKPRAVGYRTSPRFLELFGLERLEDLPQSDELDLR